MNQKQIVLKKVKVHNLKSVNLTIDANQLIVLTGVSGSGKSSLAFDTIYVEGQRRYIESLSTFARRQLAEMTRPDAELISGISPTIAIEQKTAGRNPRSTVGTMTGIYDYLRVVFARIATPYCPISGRPVSAQSTPQIIHNIASSSNGSKLIILSPYCKEKKGEFKEEFADFIRKGFTRIRLDGKMVDLSEEIAVDGKSAHTIDLVIDRIIVTPEEHPRLTEAVTKALEEGKGVMSTLDLTSKEEILYSKHAFSQESGVSYAPLEPHDFSFNHPLGMCLTCEGLGITYEEEEEICPSCLCSSCLGCRIRPYPAAAQLRKKRIFELMQLPVDKCLQFFEGLSLSSYEEIIAGELIKEVKERLLFLKNVGLHYITLERTAPTLSGGEAQRVRLASQIGSGLSCATYVLDEPSIGLHPRDNHKLIATLRELCAKGNTVIVVEHDEETIFSADEIVDIGPFAGEKGGEILVQGSIQDVMGCTRSITGAYLCGKLKIPIPKKRRSGNGLNIVIEKAEHHNLKKISVAIPLGKFVAVTGVSGSGKSSLISEILYPALSNELHGASLPLGKHKKLVGMEHIDKVIGIDQSPIGRTPRSNPATYIKLFDEIRDLFSQLPESAAAGFTPGRFSFNVKDGSCPHCSGMGMMKIDMDFMEDEWVSCTICKGKRFDETTLSVLYKGKSIYDVLEMRVSDALVFFSAIPSIRHKLETLERVGLDYIRLGQPSPTLSGGEAQRIKLAKELSRPGSGKTLYLLDEPTTGLHFHDISTLLNVLQAFVDKGNTVLVIEHNMDLVKAADWIIDLGPEGGEEGGYLIAEGTPEKIAKMDTSTGKALSATFTARKKKTVQPLKDSGIVVEGAFQNNLKHVNAIIPRGKITVCTGPSGSGKSSFAFETIYAEGQRRYIETMSPYARQFVKQMAKPKVERIEGLLASIAIEQKSHSGNPRSTVGTMTEVYDFLRVLFAHLGIAYSPETKEEIKTISKEYVADTLLKFPEKSKLYILSPLTLERKEKFDVFQDRLISQGFLRIRLNKKHYSLDEEIPYNSFRKNELMLVIDRLIIGEGIRERLLEAIERAAKESEGVLLAEVNGEDHFFNLSFATASGKSYPPLTPHSFSFNTDKGMCQECKGIGSVYIPIKSASPLKQVRSFWKRDLPLPKQEIICPSCQGERINPLARNVLIQGKSIADVCKMPISDALKCIAALQIAPSKAFLEETVEQLKSRLHFLEAIGLHYISLDRTAPTLSGGETQRIRLARQLGSGLTGCLYILDEPTIGLHPHNNELLNSALKKLRELGNTLLLVEHDPMTVSMADYLFDFGPMAGKAGGKIVAEGTIEEIKKNPLSLTGDYLSGRKKIPIPSKRRKGVSFLTIQGASLHNLKQIDVSFPLAAFSCISGVSGSGKSSLFKELIASLPAKQQLFDKVIAVHQNPLGHTIRADVSTYTDILTPLRYFFASLPHAKMKGLLPRHFSFNHKKGMCSSCRGIGTQTVELQFLPPAKVPCEACNGFRLNPLSLSVKTKERHLGEILQLTVKEAREEIVPIPKAIRLLDSLISVGLGYLRLDQEIATLSGGEAQRLRLSRELAKRSQGNTLYLFDEPTIGLHSCDVAQLLSIFHALVDKGNTVILIEHNLDVLANADYIVDLGPDAGDKGGEVVAQGTPEEVMREKRSYTGKYLKRTLNYKL